VNKDSRIELLRSLWLFEQCSRKELEAIAKVTTIVDVPEGKVLTREGQTGKECFVIVSGAVEATRGNTRVGELGTGQFFGEMSLLEREPRIATVTTTEPTTLLVLTAQAFDGLVATTPTMDRKLLIGLAHRLRELETRYVPQAARVLVSDVA